MRVYNSRQWKVARLQAKAAAEYVCQVPAAPRRWSVLVAVTSITGDDCNKPGLAFEPQNHAALCPSLHSVETNREIAEARGEPERGCDVNGFPLSERHPWFQNDGAASKKIQP